MKTLRSCGLILAIVAGISLFLIGKDGIASLQKPVDLYADDTNVTKLGNLKAVEADVYAVLDCYASEVTTTKRNGSVTGQSEDFYYIIPAFNGEETYYIGLKASEKNSRAYDKLADITWEWLSGASSTYGESTEYIAGRMAKMDDELYDYMVEWFQEAEWFETDAEISKYVLPVYISPIISFNNTRILFLVCVAALSVGIVMVVVSMVLEKKRGKAAKEQMVVVINGVSYPKETFDRVNSSIRNKEAIFAVQELRDITGISLEEAQNIVDHWNEYYL